MDRSAPIDPNVSVWFLVVPRVLVRLFRNGPVTMVSSQALSGRSKEVKVDVPYSKCKLILKLRIVLCKSYPTVQFHPKNRPN